MSILNFDVEESLKARSPAPYLANKGELRNFLVQLINICNKVPETDRDEEIRTEAYLKAPSVIKELIEDCVPGLISHNVRALDANEPLIGSFYREPVAKPIGKTSKFVYSGSTNLKRKLFWTKGAAYLGKKRFLAAQFQYDNKLTSVAEELYEFHGKTDQSDVVTILQELGLSIEYTNALTQAICEAFDSKPKYACNPQILWPIGNEEYMNISPVASCAMQREIYERKEPYQQLGVSEIDEDAEGRQPLFRDFETINVGGSNPGNAGDLSSSLVGKFKLLKVRMPPHTDIWKKPLWNIIFSQGTAVYLKEFTDKFSFSSFLTKIVRLDQHSFTMENKDELKWVLECRGWLDHSFHTVLKLYFLIKDESVFIPEWVMKKMDKRELAFYACASGEGKLQEEINEFSRFCVLMLKEEIQIKTCLSIMKEERPGKKPGDFIDIAMRNFLEKVFANYLNEAVAA